MVQRGVSPATPQSVANPFWSLPNLLTYGRIIAIPALVACFFVKGDWGRWAAMWIFIAAGVSVSALPCQRSTGAPAGR